MTMETMARYIHIYTLCRWKISELKSIYFVFGMLVREIKKVNGTEEIERCRIGDQMGTSLTITQSQLEIIGRFILEG